MKQRRVKKTGGVSKEAVPEAQAGAAPQGQLRAGLVAIVGRPNVGKSTLLNALLGYKLAIVSAKPQTTRHRLLGALSGPGFQVGFLDTPGVVRRARDALDRMMVRAALQTLDEADVVVLVVEPRPPGDVELQLVEALRRRNLKALLAINKVDVVAKPAVLPVMESYGQLQHFLEIVPISALKQDGLGLLMGLIIKHLPLGEPLYEQDFLTDRPERFLVGELVREKVFSEYAQEVPYDVTVEVETFREAGEGTGRKDFIQVVIYVGKESQKGILIGKGGEALKNVAMAARQDIESLLGRPVFLELWVRVQEKWRQDIGFLRRLGH